MDALFSLPLLSVFLLPVLTSYTTSLNLLLFYLTWTTLILSHSALKVEFLGTLFVRTLFYLLPSYVFLAFDCAAPSVATNLKHHGDEAIATHEAHGRGRWWRVALLSTANVLLGVAAQTAVDALLTEGLHVRSALRVSASLPLPWMMAKDVVQGFLLRELFTFVLHRYVLHGPRSPLRSPHASYYHSLPATYSLAAHYDHPLAYLVRVFLPTYLPAALFRYHLLTYQAFLALVSLEELLVYSGYNYLPSGFITGRIARRHERHLMGGGDGNFGAYGVADLLAGTNAGTDFADDARDEAERKEVGSRAKSKVNQVAKKARKGRG